MSKRSTCVALFAMVLNVCAPGLTRAAPAGDGGTMAMPSDDALRAAPALTAPLAVPNVGPLDGAAVRAHADAMVEQYRAVDYDPASRAAELAGGIEPSFNLVRDEVRFEAYPGVLRGASGAYAGRAANAPDRAVLLAELLKAKNVATRFARGTLSREQAEVLYARMFEPDVPPAASAASARRADPALGRALADRIKARATRDYAAIRKALGDVPPQSADAAAAEREAVLGEIARHVWVQAKVDDAWIDLDASFADAAPGKAYCRSEQTFEELPDELHQRVTVRVVTETLAGAELKRQTVLELTRPAVEWVDGRVFLFHAPETAGGTLGGIGGGAATGNWVPLLWVDGELARGKAIVFDDAQADGAAGFAALNDALGGGGAPVEGAPTLVAEVIEFEVALPGGKTETVRRALFDRATPAWRRTKPLDPATLPPLPRDGAGPVAMRAVHNVWFSGGRHDLSAYARATKVIVDALYAPAPAAATAPTTTPRRGLGPSDVFWLLAMQNVPCVLWGDHALIPALNDDPNVRFYVDSPRVLMFSATAAPVAGRADQVEVELVTDLRRDKVRGVARDASAASSVAQRKVWYGVLAGALEHELGAQQFADMGAGTVPLASTSALLKADGVVVLRPDEKRNPQAWRGLATNPAVAAALAGELEGGQTLVVPKAVVAHANPGDAGTGWWAIGPAGDTRAVGAGALHALRAKSPLRAPSQVHTDLVHIINDDLSSTSRRTGSDNRRKSGGGRQRPGEEYTVLLEISIGTITVTSTYATAVIMGVIAASGAICAYSYFSHER